MRTRGGAGRGRRGAVYQDAAFTPKASTSVILQFTTNIKVPMKVVLVVLAIVGLSQAQLDPSLLLLPIPADYRLGNSTAAISSRVKLSGPSCESFVVAFERFKWNAFSDHEADGKDDDIILSVDVDIENPHAKLSLVNTPIPIFDLVERQRRVFS
jgi:hypothetical protein